MTAQVEATPSPCHILAINFNHDGSAVILTEGTIAAYIKTERFSRLKKDPGLRAVDLQELLDQANLSLPEIDHVLLCNLHSMDTPDIPALHGTTLKETWFDFWVNQTNTLVRIGDIVLPCTVNPDHHVLHAATAFYTSPFESAITLVTDPLGCRAFIGRDTRIYPIRRTFDDDMQASIGYCHVADQLFGSSIFGAGKVMGLAPYGAIPHPLEVDPGSIATFEQLVRLSNQAPAYIAQGNRQLNARLAYYIQLGLELQLTSVLQQMAGICRRNNVPLQLCLSGGTALNSVANQLAFAASDFEQLHLHPACGDDGTAIGAALWYWHDQLGNPRRSFANPELMYGQRHYDDQIDSALAAYGERLEIETTGTYIERAAQLLTEGAIIGWFQGASEIGPRALGNRSILADPRDPAMKDRLNQKVKFREHFRPFAPTVLNEHAQEWFGLSDSPFMLRVTQVHRPDVPAITHVDGTARIQTLQRRDNPPYYDLIEAFRRITGVPLVINTSFNIKGEPIVETPRDALECLLHSELDYVCFPNRIVRKRSGSVG